MTISIFNLENSDTPQFIRLGKVSSINRKECTAKVHFEDLDDAVSYDLQIVVKNTMKSKHYWMPYVGEVVLCLFLPNGEETGFILGSVYNEVDKPVPEISDEGKERVGLWIDQNNYIKWVEEERRFIVRTENPVLFEVI